MGAVFPAEVTHGFHWAICSPDTHQPKVWGRSQTSPHPFSTPTCRVRLILVWGPQ